MVHTYLNIDLYATLLNHYEYAHQYVEIENKLQYALDYVNNWCDINHKRNIS